MTDEKEFHIEDEDMSMDDVLALSNIRLNPKEMMDSIINATVVGVSQEEVTVDLGFKSEAFISISEFEEDGSINIKVGDEIKVFLVRKEGPEGLPVVSYKKAKDIEVSQDIFENYQSKIPVEAVIKKAIKGGYEVSVGLNAFMPFSQAPYGLSKDDAIGKTCKVLITKYTRDGGNIVVSARDYENIERDKIKQETLSKIQVGFKTKGVVKNITKYGAFVDIGGIDGLLHISDMSWSRLGDPNSVLEVGQEIDVVVLSYDEQNQKLSLGLKQLSEDPWDNIEYKIKIGSVVTGKVVHLIKVGAIIELMDGVDGFIHISDLSWTKKIRNISDVLSLGDTVKAKVMGIDKDRRQINLGLKQIETNPWEEVEKRYQVDTVINGVVTNITDFGAFVKLEEGIDGMIHVENMSWNDSVKHPKEILKPGDVVEAVVLNINTKDHRIALGLKQKEQDPFKKYKPEQNHKVKIIKVLEKSLIVQLEDGFEGIIPHFQTGVDKEAALANNFKEGDDLVAKIVKVDHEKRSLVFSLKAYEKEKEREEVEAYLGANDFNPTFGDMLNKKLKEKLQNNLENNN